MKAKKRGGNQETLEVCMRVYMLCVVSCVVSGNVGLYGLLTYDSALVHHLLELVADLILIDIV